MSPTGQRALRYGIVAAAIAALLALVVAFFPWNALRGPVAAYLSHRLHRDVTIDGALRVHVGRPIVIDIDDFSVANAEWSDVQPMAHAARVTLTFSIPSLLHFSPDAIRLVEPRLILEKNANGEANWQLAHGGSGMPALGDIFVDQGTLHYRDPRSRGDITVAVQTSSPSANAAQELRFDGRGTLRDEPFTISGRGHGISALRRVDDPYRLAFNVKAGQTTIDFDGTVVPAQPQNARGALHVRGPDLARLYPIVPSPLPWTPPYDLQGDLVHEPGKWHFQNISGTIGKTDLAGRYSIDKSSGRPVTLADLESRRLDYRDLAGFIGMHPGASGANTNAGPKRAETREPANGKVLPDTPFNLGKLRDHDVDLRLRGTSVRWGRFPLDNLDMHVVLGEGTLHLQPLDFGIAGGHVVSDISVDFTKEVPSGKAQVEIRRVELKRLFPQLATPQGSAGRFGGRGHFTTAGSSVADLLGSLNGEAAVAMSGGEMSTLTLVLTNLDLARAAALLASGKREKAAIHCAISAMHAKNGQLVPDFMVVDSEDELIRGSGSIDFRNEQYNVTLNADSKKPSLVALRGPIEITGTFANPVVHPAVGQAVARVGAAVGLGILAPPLALLPLIDLGDAPSADCRALYRKADLAAGTGAAPRAAPSSHGGKGEKEPGEKLAGGR
jgi:AsmA family protein